MPSTTSNELLVAVNNSLNDPGYIKWPKQELLDHLNDAQKAIVIRRPDAFTVDIDDFKCVAGTKQTIPAEGLRLIDVPKNETGKPIKGPFDREILDDNIPNWHSFNTSTVAEVYIYDERNPKTFYLHPGVAEDTLISLVYSKSPEIITLAENDSAETPSTIVVDDAYKNAIYEFILYRCYAKDAEYAADPNKSSMHFTAFRSELGEKSQADGAMAGITKD
jgi:hypothetical protein